MRKGARVRLAHTLRLLRTVHGWSQEELASKSGLHRTYISLIERTACSVTLDSLERLAEAFGIALPELLGATDPADIGARLMTTLSKAGSALNTRGNKPGKKKRSS